MDYFQLIAIYIGVIFSLRNSYDLYYYCHKRNKAKNKNTYSDDYLGDSKTSINRILVDGNMWDAKNDLKL